MRKRMKNIGSLLLSLSIMFVGENVFSQTTQQNNTDTNQVLNLDLATALKIAHDNNPTIKIANLEIQRVDYSKKENLGSLLPNVSATGQYTNNIMKSVMFVPASMAAAFGGQSYMEIGYKNSYTGTVSASLPLINFSLWEQIKSKQTDIDLIIEQARSSKINMTKQVKDAYYGVLLAKSSLKVLEQSIANAKEVLKTTKASYDNGLSSEYDYIRAQVQVNNLNPSYISAKNSVDLAILQLKMILSLSNNQKINITEKLEDYENNVSLLNNYEKDTILATNTELRQIDLNIQSLQHKLKMTNSQHLPSLSAFGQYQYLTQAEDFRIKDYDWVSSAAVGLQLNIPIFQGNKVINQAKQVKIALKELELQRNYTTDGMNLQITSAVNNMRAANEQLIANKDAINQAQRGYEIAKVRYNTGSGTILELNDSELSLTQSKLNYQQSLYNYLSAQTNLEKVLGKE
ncbi:MAG: TolC family protein [Bacteroidales bacterium]|jgi:outer membrane protein|nr:TolC family protein [Bacteroidales bacterium]